MNLLQLSRLLTMTDLELIPDNGAAGTEKCLEDIILVVSIDTINLANTSRLFGGVDGGATDCRSY